jgi:hypothetical protein
MPKEERRKGILQTGAPDNWNAAGWKILKVSTILFTVLAFLASFAAMQNGGVTFNGMLVEGWRGVWYTTAIAAIAGAIFGCIWLVLFKALSLASKGK